MSYDWSFGFTELAFDRQLSLHVDVTDGATYELSLVRSLARMRIENISDLPTAKTRIPSRPTVGVKNKSAQYLVTRITVISNR